MILRGQKDDGSRVDIACDSQGNVQISVNAADTSTTSPASTGKIEADTNNELRVAI